MSSGLSPCTVVVAGLLNTTKIVMSAPLPRVYETGEGGKAVAVAPAPGTAGIIGGDFKADELTRVSKETVRLAHMCQTPDLLLCLQ